MCSMLWPVKFAWHCYLHSRVMAFRDITGVGDFSLDELMGIPTQSLVGERYQTTSNSRFSMGPASEEAFREKLLQRIPPNTRKSTTWAVNVYTDWISWRLAMDQTLSDSHFPIPTLEEAAEAKTLLDFQKWDYWLARYV